MENNIVESIVDLSAQEEDDEYYIDDPVIDIILNRPTDLYNLSVGQITIDKSFEDMTSFIQSHSWSNVGEAEEFDYKQYSDYLEYLLYVIFSDLNQASQIMAGILNMVDKSSGINPDFETYTKHSVRKAFAHYIFGQTASSTDLLKLNSEYDFNSVISYYDSAPVHIKTSIADYLQKVTPTVYNTPD